MEALNFKILAALAHKALVFARQQLHAGHVGIGSTSPGQMLTVAGTIQSTSGGVMYPDGTTQNTGWE